MTQEIFPIDTMLDNCQPGDILKIYYEKGGFRVGIYRGISESKPLISNIFGERENNTLCRSYQHDWIIFIPEKRKVFCSNTSEGANISSYSILEKSVQSQAKCTPDIRFFEGNY